MEKKGIVLLFGAFNPFTNAHLMIGRLAAEAFPEHRICYVPARLAYFKNWKGSEENDVLAEDLRYDLISGSIEGLDRFTVTDIELKGIVNGRTYNTVAYFREVLGYTDIVLCMGTDKMAELETWFMGRELIAENRFLIITRDGNSVDDCLTEYDRQHRESFLELKNTELADLSATRIREAAERGDLEFVKANVPPYVFSRLYKTE